MPFGGFIFPDAKPDGSARRPRPFLRRKGKDGDLYFSEFRAFPEGRENHQGMRLAGNIGRETCLQTLAANAKRETLPDNTPEKYCLEHWPQKRGA